MMDPTVLALEPKIRQILSAPGTDLATISAKRVRKQLIELDSSLENPVKDKDKKEQIDKVIAKVYEEISAAHQQTEEDDVPLKRKREDAFDGEAQKKTKKAKSKQELSDAELARQLQNEFNGRVRSSRAASSKPKANGSKRGAKKGHKSSSTINSDGEEQSGDDNDKPKKRGGGFKKEYKLSEPLAALLGLEKLSRPQIVKHLWDHIKANNMQNPENRKEIICDEFFRSIFKCDRIDMFKMNKELGQHLYEAPTAS